MGERNSGSIKTEGNGTEPTTSTSSRTTSTSNGGRGRGRGATSTEPTEKTSQLPVVNGSPKIVAVEVPNSGTDKPEEKKGRGRPKGSGTGKAKNTPKPSQGQADYQQLKILLITITGIAAGKMESPVFMLSNEEAEQLAKPLANILAKNEGVSAVTSEYADHIALAFACLTIFVPKYFMYKQMKGEKKKDAVQSVSESGSNTDTQGNRPDNQTGKTNGNVKSINRGPSTSTPSSNDSQTFNGSIAGLMPSLAGF